MSDKGVEQMQMGSSRSANRDEAMLSRLGKKSVLKRNFGFMPILGFSCTVLITWEAILFLFAQGLSNGGPAGIIYGYLIVWIGTFSNFVTLSELASMAPTSGGQYHFVSMLAPKSCQKFLSYTTAWLTVLGWQTFVASGGLLAGTMLQGLIILCNDTYVPQLWHGTLLTWALMAFMATVNCLASGVLPQFEGLIFIVHLAGFFAILIPLVLLGPHAPAEVVFKTFLNNGNWPTQGLSFFIGMIGNVFAFFGADAAIHMSEEIENAVVVVPRSILTAMGINGALGFGMAVALLFCIGDIEAALMSPTGFPHMEIFRQAVQSTAGAAAMSSIVVVMIISSGVGIVAAASRMLWSFARDGLVPGWRFLSSVDPRTLIPIPAVATTVIITCLLALINIGSAIAFRSIISLAIAALLGSYFLVMILFLWRRVKGDIQLERNLGVADSGTSLMNVAGAPLVWGPWRVPGWFGVLNNAFSCAYITVVFFFSFWPSVTPVQAETMNYSILMFGAVMLFSVVWYVVQARKWYNGPVIETGYRSRGSQQILGEGEWSRHLH